MSATFDILFSEGASPSARHSSYILGSAGHRIDICDPQRLCLARFSRFVRRYYRCPFYAARPADWLRWIRRKLDDGKYDVLFPVHDQVLLLARFRHRFGDVGLAVPPFESVRAIQSKTGFARTLDRIQLPQPAYVAVRQPNDLRPPWDYPFYVKADYSVAGQGVWRIDNDDDLAQAKTRLLDRGHLNGTKEAVMQEPGVGNMCVVQAVFQEGRLIGCHSYATPGGGVGGSAFVRESVSHPVMVEHLHVLGRKLDWHGAMHAEYFHDPRTDTVQFLELNPRIGETLNATRAGVNLCDLMVRISLGERIDTLQVSRPGVRTHNLMLRLLGVAEQGWGRRGLIAEALNALRGRKEFSDSEEELMRLGDDALSVLPTAWVGLQLLAWPGRVQGIVRGAMKSVALSERAVQAVAEMPDD